MFLNAIACIYLSGLSEYIPMNENGEQLRICPNKLAAERARYGREVGVPLIAIDGQQLPDADYARRAARFKPKPAKELSCPSDCPGARTETRRILGIPLPAMFDIKVCPLNLSATDGQ